MTTLNPTIEANPATALESASIQPIPSTNASAMPVSPSANAKRKYNEALSLLDDATGSKMSDSVAQPPAKRPRTSLYATFAKYGIGTNSRQAHHTRTSSSGLARLLQRAKSQSGRDAFDDDNAKNEHPDYNPTSRTDFLARLQTFKLMTYSSKPPEIDSVAAARHGWNNGEGKESLVCKTCGANWVMAPKPSTAELTTWVTSQTKSLLDQHKSACPWKVRPCEPSIYSMPMPSPSALAKEVLQRALRVETVLEDIQIKHPLNQNQLRLITSAISSAKMLARSSTITETPEGMQEDDESPSETSCIVAFFGWDYTNNPPITRTDSFSRPSTPTINLSRSNPTSRPYKNTMLTCHLCQRQVGLWAFTATTQPPKPTNGSPEQPPPAATNRRASGFGVPSSSKHFDILKEHRTHCPYVVKATYIPSLIVASQTPASLNVSKRMSAVEVGMGAASQFQEGWKAQLNVLSRSQWRRASGLAALGVPSNAPTPAIEQSDPLQSSSATTTEVDQVSRIVNTVKTKHGGGRELLRFVKGLLG